MINKKLINPSSIAVIGGSNDLSKAGGKILWNLLRSSFRGDMFVVNPKLDTVQGVKSFPDTGALPQTDLAIIAIPARFCPETVEILASQKGTRAFIIVSAGFSEEGEAGAELEKRVVEIVNIYDGTLIGPNCIGFLNSNYSGVFTTPVPVLDPMGVDFVSGSGATAVFIMESAIPNGLRFSSVWSVGNSAQTGVEDVIRHLDETYVEGESPKVKLLYLESIRKPGMLLKHASSLIRKGCHIAAIKAGSSEAGSRAASSHTGALATPDAAVDALFRKAGIVRCFSRTELGAVAAVFMHPVPSGKNMAIITHAGGPAVMLTDALSEGGVKIPFLGGDKTGKLLESLYPGSSVANPIDFLATGTAEQLGSIIDTVENDLDEVDSMVVIFGSPGLFPVTEVYDLLDKKMKNCRKPVYPILPSVMNAREDVEEFISRGRMNFPDEVIFGRAFCKVINGGRSFIEDSNGYIIDTALLGTALDDAEDGYLSPHMVATVLDAAGINRVPEKVVHSANEAADESEKLGFPVVMKVVGPLHKSDSGGVILNIKDRKEAEEAYGKIMAIAGAVGALIQPMISGTELFVGLKEEGSFGHMVLAGMGGIYIEVLKDFSQGLVPVFDEEAAEMVRSLKSYPLFKGVRGGKPINEKEFAQVIRKLSALAEAAPGILEMDINPLLAGEKGIWAVDARIKYSREVK